MSGEVTRYVVTFIGRVQGVGFRATAISQARGLDVHGFVRNEPDGSVLMDVEGHPADLKRLIAKIESAMIGNVDETRIDERPAANHAGGLTIKF